MVGTCLHISFSFLVRLIELQGLLGLYHVTNFFSSSFSQHTAADCSICNCVASLLPRHRSTVLTKYGAMRRCSRSITFRQWFAVFTLFGSRSLIRARA